MGMKDSASQIFSKLRALTLGEAEQKFVQKDVYDEKTKNLDERCGRHEKRIEAVEKKLSNIQNVAIAILIAVVVELGYLILRGGL